MIVVYQDINLIPQEMREEGRRLTELLLAENDLNNRAKLIENNAIFWRGMKDSLLKMSNGKCWYSEAKDKSGHYHVDHFRPKKRVKRSKQIILDEGYYWLAFDWMNYRLAGSVLNIRKSDRFPLLDGSPSAFDEGLNKDVEFPILLDPVNPEDVGLLHFDERGKVLCASHDPVCILRVEQSTNILNLDHKPLVEGRQKVWRACRQKITDIRDAIRAQAPGQNPMASHLVQETAKEVRDMANADAEFSSTAKACIKANQAEWIWDIPYNRQQAA